MLFEDDPPKLVGIARLASASPTLATKRKVEYLELETRNFIGRASGLRMYFTWTINPYRGCEFGCKYCYARYAHEFMELRDPELFEQKIYAKRFHPVAFRSELRKVKKEDSLWMGTATDPYQPAERRYEISRKILQVLSRQRHLEFGITTKSDLVARDIDLLSQMAENNKVRVHLTITTLDESLARLLEPRAPRPELRLNAVNKLTDARIPVTVLAHPIMPLINDSEESLDRVCQAAAACGASNFSAAPLFLKPCAQKVFFPFLEEHFPHLVRKYRERYEQNAYLKGHYPEMLKDRIAKIKGRYPMKTQDEPVWPIDEQLSLYNIK